MTGVFNERVPGRHFTAGDILLAVLCVLINIASLFIAQVIDNQTLAILI